MSDPISKLHALTSHLKAREEELRSSFKQLEQRLKDASGGYGIRGQSANCLLADYGYDACYGYLFFDDELAVAYRTRDEDMQAEFDHEPREESAYSVQNLDTCRPEWMRSLSAPAIIESLFTSINGKLEEALKTTAGGVEALAASSNLPLKYLDAGLVAAAKQLDFGGVIQHWQDAQSALGVDPPDATTRASSLMETLLKHILHAKNKPLSGKEDIQELYKLALRELPLSSEEERSEDLTRIVIGIKTAVSGIGALRNHASTAHGKGPSNQPITFSQARLAVNATGVLATFLMDALIADNSGSDLAEAEPLRKASSAEAEGASPINRG